MIRSLPPGQTGRVVPPSASRLELLSALESGNTEAVRALLRAHADLRASIDEPIAAFEAPAILQARSREMLDVLLEAGADINARSQWWAGGFGLLDVADAELAEHAIARGAVMDVHAAARLGHVDRLDELLTADPSLVHARGGDGQMPLHVARRLDAAQLLIDRGADVNARDIDHESTPAQYMTDGREDLARLVISRGGTTDLLLAAAIGDVDLARRLLDADPAGVRMRVDGTWFPMTDRRAGGTIYQWTLGFHVSSHHVARQRGHQGVQDLLFERSPVDVQLLESCWAGHEAEVRAIRQRHPEVVAALGEADRRQVAHAARNDQAEAVRLMLESGWSVEACGQHGATPLHWAAFHGNTAMLATILAFNPPLEAEDADFHGTPLGWAIHGSEHGWGSREDRDYAATVERLLAAGARPPDSLAGSRAVRDALRRHGSP